jgi:hypothetical protein
MSKPRGPPKTSDRGVVRVEAALETAHQLLEAVDGDGFVSSSKHAPKLVLLHRMPPPLPLERASP